METQTQTKVWILEMEFDGERDVTVWASRDAGLEAMQAETDTWVWLEADDVEWSESEDGSAHMASLDGERSIGLSPQPVMSKTDEAVGR